MPKREQSQILPDLLRERRLELGLPEPSAPRQLMRPLLLRGGVIGGAALLLSMGSIVVIGRSESQQQQRLQALLPVEQQLAS